MRSISKDLGGGGACVGFGQYGTWRSNYIPAEVGIPGGSV